MKSYKIITIFILMLIPLVGIGSEELNSIRVTGLPTKADMMKETPPLIMYKNLEQVKRLSNSKPTVLFFKANWCPSCIAAEKSFIKNNKKLDGVNLVVVDYDKSSDLKVKYGVTYQHTFVQVSNNGDAIVKWNGGSTNDFLKKIVKEDM